MSRKYFYRRLCQCLVIHPWQMGFWLFLFLLAVRSASEASSREHLEEVPYEVEVRNWVVDQLAYFEVVE